jgi:hypothetical protein
MNILRFIRTGIIAGAISAFCFALIHDLFISDIWFSLPIMLAAGGVCGLCLGWTYGLLFEAPSIQSWVQYNALYVGMFALLGGVSVLVFEPVTTIAALVAANAPPPDDLFRKAMPLTMVFTLLMAAAIGKLYARKWSHYAAILLTCSVLVLLLGLNVSAIGLVSIPRSSLYLIVELMGLIVALNVAFAIVFAVLERRIFLPALTTSPFRSGNVE